MKVIDIHYINSLLDRYMEGENTQEELRELKDYFRQTNDLPQELHHYKEMFDMLEKPAVIPSQEALESLVTPRPVKKQLRRWSWIATACAVACVLLLMTLHFFDHQSVERPIVAKQEPQRDNKIMKEVKEQKSSIAQEVSIVKNENSIVAQRTKTCRVLNHKESIRMQVEKSPSHAPSTIDTQVEPVRSDPAELMQREFTAQSTSIRQRGEQVMQQVAILSQQEERNKQKIEF